MLKKFLKYIAVYLCTLILWPNFAFQVKALEKGTGIGLGCGGGALVIGSIMFVLLYRNSKKSDKAKSCSAFSATQDETDKIDPNLAKLLNVSFYKVPDGKFCSPDHENFKLIDVYRFEDLPSQQNRYVAILPDCSKDAYANLNRIAFLKEDTFQYSAGKLNSRSVSTGGRYWQENGEWILETTTNERVKFTKFCEDAYQNSVRPQMYLRFVERENGSSQNEAGLATDTSVSEAAKCYRLQYGKPGENDWIVWYPKDFNENQVAIFD